jgi:hypothetical protein
VDMAPIPKPLFGRITSLRFSKKPGNRPKGGSTTHRGLLKSREKKEAAL